MIPLYRSIRYRYRRRCRTQNAAFLRALSVLIFFLPLFFLHTAYGDINADLRAAARAGNTTRVGQLLEQGADVNTKDGFGTALMWAAGWGHTETVKVLIDAGADVNATGKSGYTALMMSAGLAVGARKSHTETVRVLIDAGAEVYAESEDGDTAVMWAARRGFSEIVEILKRAEAQTKSTAYVNINAELVEAVYSGNTARVEQLLRQGADVNVEQKNGWTVLMDAAKEGRTEIVEVLIEAGADMAKYGDTALMFSLRHTETAKALIEAGADVNAKHEDGFTPLLLAARGGQAEMVRALIEAGADVNAKIENGFTVTVVEMAEMSGHPEIVEILEQAGARR